MPVFIKLKYSLLYIYGKDVFCNWMRKIRFSVWNGYVMTSGAENTLLILLAAITQVKKAKLIKQIPIYDGSTHLIGDWLVLYGLIVIFFVIKLNKIWFNMRTLPISSRNPSGSHTASAVSLLPWFPTWSFCPTM